MGLGATMTGSADLSEVPPAMPMNDPRSLQANWSSYVPAGENPNVCHTSSPWNVVQAFIESQFRSAFWTPTAKKKIIDLQDQPEFKKRLAEFQQRYSKVLNGSWTEVELDIGESSYFIEESDHGVPCNCSLTDTEIWGFEMKYRRKLQAEAVADAEDLRQKMQRTE